MLVHEKPFPPLFMPKMAPAGRRLSGNGDPVREPSRRPQAIDGEAAAIAACDGVIDLLASVFSVCGRQLRAPNRSATDIARIRQIGMYVAHVTLGVKMADVAAGFARNKSTVVHACHLIEDMREDADFDRIIAKVEEIVRIAFSIGIRETTRD